MLRLSVLDQSPIRKGCTPSDAIRETLLLAKKAEELGYYRFWVAEHHSHPMFAGTSPEVLIGQLASITSTIRVGSGGVMLSHYSPLKVAENFRVLESIYPGRIDLGLGRAPGADRLTSSALSLNSDDFNVDRFPQKIRDLRCWLSGDLHDDHPFKKVDAMPIGESIPQMWLLGSSDQGAIIASHFGVSFCFAHFISGNGASQVMDYYKKNFKPSSENREPLGSLAIFVVCAETEEEAKYLAESRPLMMLRSRRGEGGGVPTPDESLSYNWTELERNFADSIRRRTIIGNPEQIKEKLLEFSKKCGVNELIIVNTSHSFEARLKTYELLSKVFNLKID